MESSREWAYQKFSDYYKDPRTEIPAPLKLEQRECGYLLFKERFMVRHRRFSTIDSFRKVLAEIVPSDVYHSCAYYENPDYDMDKKGWIGADLVFDLVVVESHLKLVHAANQLNLTTKSGHVTFASNPQEKKQPSF